MRYRARGLLYFLSLVLLLPVAGLLTASPAGAQDLRDLSDVPVTSKIDLTCTMAGNAELSPGVSLLSEQKQQVEGVVKGGTAVSPLTPCTSVTGIPYKGFTMVGGGSGTTTCSTALLGGKLHGTGRVSWDNGDTSVVDWTLTLVGPAPVVDATIRSGALAGATLVVAAAPGSLTGNCVLNPLTNLGFNGAVEIVNAV